MEGEEGICSTLAAEGSRHSREGKWRKGDWVVVGGMSWIVVSGGGDKWVGHLQESFLASDLVSAALPDFASEAEVDFLPTFLSPFFSGQDNTLTMTEGGLSLCHIVCCCWEM